MAMAKKKLTTAEIKRDLAAVLAKPFKRARVHHVSMARHQASSNAKQDAVAGVHIGRFHEEEP